METTILTPFLNRAAEFDPAGWFQLVPKGSFPIKRKEGDAVKTYIQVVDEIACDRIAAAFANRQAANPNFQLLVGFEHFAHQEGGTTEAACWINALEKRADGIWAKGDWTPDGTAAIKNRKYRFLSPVWFPRQTEVISGNRFRPVEVNDAGLTNMPNLGDALQPFWNRADSFHGREASTETQPSMIKIITLLGLAATATEDDIVAKVQAFKNRVAELEPFQNRLTTLQTEHDGLKTKHTALLTTTVEKTLAEYKGVITAESQDAWKNRLTADFDGTVGLLKGLKPAATTKIPVHKGKKAVETTETVDGEDAFMNRVGEVMVQRKIDKADAIAAVAGEEPALYDAYREAINGGSGDE
jgi:phage I-like protein